MTIVGASANWQDAELVTPLILAAFKNQVAVVRSLLEAGADPAIRDQWNRRAAGEVRHRGRDDPILRLLFVHR